MQQLEREATVRTDHAWGGQSMVAPLRRVLVREPAPPAPGTEFTDFAYPGAVDHERARQEHRAFRDILEAQGVAVTVAGPDAPGLLDAIFSFDTSLITDAGAVLLRPGKALRLPEVSL